MELKMRSQPNTEMVSASDIVARVRSEIDRLQKEIAQRVMAQPFGELERV